MEILKQSSLRLYLWKGSIAENADLFVSKIPPTGLRVRTCLKVMKRNKDALQSFANELKTGTFRHFAIGPVYGIYQDVEQVCVLSAFFELGYLKNLIRSDEKIILESGKPFLEPCDRLRIAQQIASAISFIHTKDYVHMGIKSLNIVLDANKNAKLVDFGSSAESDCDFDPMSGTICYLPDDVKGIKPKRLYDYYSFGVVIAELVTGESPHVTMVHQYGFAPCSRKTVFLKNDFQNDTDMCRCYIEKNARGLKWQKNMFKSMTGIAKECLNSINNEAFKFNEMVVDRLKALGRQGFASFERYSCLTYKTNTTEKNVLCERCLLNPALDNSSIDHVEHDKKCTKNLQLCQVCANSNYMNPIVCHSCDFCHPKVDGCCTAMILIAGDGNVGDATESRVFENDIDQVARAFAERLPRVNRYRVREFYQFTEACELIEKDGKISTVILFYSGHYGSSEFSLRGQNLSKNELETAINMLLSKKSRVFLFLDCCGAPDNLNVLQAKGDFIQLNASKSIQKTYGVKGKHSLFSQLIVQALDQRRRCKDACSICEKFFSPNDKVYVSLGNIAKYVQRHYKKRNYDAQVRKVSRESPDSDMLVFNMRSNITIDMTLIMPNMRDMDTISVEYHLHFNEIARMAFSRFFTNYSDRCSCYDDQIKDVIEMKNMITDENITSEADLIDVWNRKQNISVSLRATIRMDTIGNVIIFQTNRHDNCQAPHDSKQYFPSTSQEHRRLFRRPVNKYCRISDMTLIILN